MAGAREHVLMVEMPEGWRLPVLDVSAAAFALPDPAAELATLEAAIERAAQRPALVRRIDASLLRLAAPWSRLARELLAADSAYLHGLTTYLMKLGPTLAPPYAGPIERQIVTSPIARGFRLRTEQMVALLTEDLAPVLLAAPEADLVLLNVGGGVCSDSWNCLIRLAERKLLGERRVTILCWDIDPQAAGTAAAILAALASQRLAGASVRVEALTGNWDSPARGRAAGARPRRRRGGLQRGRAVRIWQRCRDRGRAGCAARSRCGRRGVGEAGRRGGAPARSLCQRQNDFPRPGRDAPHRRAHRL